MSDIPLDHLSCLPFEILSLIFSHLHIECLASLSSVSRCLHRYSVAQILSRLQRATTLDDHVLILECYHPSARLSSANLFCTSIGTPGLPSTIDYPPGEEVGHLKDLCSLYTRFLPQRKEPEARAPRRHPAGDVPGSRTHPLSRVEPVQKGDGTFVCETVSLDAGELFSQLCCATNLVKMAPGSKRLMTSIVEVSDGMIRVWRDWLTEMNSREQTGDGAVDVEDPGILWVNNADEAVGIKFRVRHRETRAPLMFTCEDERAVSYYVELEGKFMGELLIKTTYLLDKIERSRQQQLHEVGSRAIIFGSYPRD